jgi:hypothetical protein
MDGGVVEKRERREAMVTHSTATQGLIDALMDAKRQLKRSGFCFEMDEAIDGKPDIYKRIDAAIASATDTAAPAARETS